MEMHLRNLQKKRTANFREDETKLLIQLWGSPVIQNKLFLTHRKAPVMRILAANMQQRGFYRTPDEIKTRIRNLKCLYHRIKRAMACGTGIGTVDTDWPHFKAMDAILCKENMRKAETGHMDDSFLEGPKCEDIKQEIEDIDIHDDMESMATNDSLGSDYDDPPPSPPPLKPAPNEKETKECAPLKIKNPPPKQQQQLLHQNKQLPILAPNFAMPAPSLQSNPGSNMRTGNVPSIPLLILNSLPQQNQDKKDLHHFQTNLNNDRADISSKLKQLLDIEKEKLKIDKKRLEVEKQRLDFDRLVGSQLLTLIPMMDGLIRHLVPSSEDILNMGEHSQRKRKRDTEEVNPKHLKSMIQERIKKYIMGDMETDEDSENEDSGIHNDDNSNSSEK